MCKDEKRFKGVEEVLKGLGNKLNAMKKDEFGILGDKLRLTEEEELTYTFFMLWTIPKERVYLEERYLKEGRLEHEEIMEKIGISRPTYFTMRSEVLESLEVYLENKGFTKGEDING